VGGERDGAEEGVQGWVSHSLQGSTRTQLICDVRTSSRIAAEAQQGAMAQDFKAKLFNSDLISPSISVSEDVAGQ
jgi:hypothetical protein